MYAGEMAGLQEQLVLRGSHLRAARADLDQLTGAARLDRLAGFVMAVFAVSRARSVKGDLVQDREYEEA